MGTATRPIFLVISVALAIGWPACPARSENPAPPPSTAHTNEPAAPLKDGSVESFFQVGPGANNAAPRALIQPDTSAANQKKTRSFAYRLYRCVWHVLDNAGVPMFFGHDREIAPDISGSYVIPAPQLPSEKAVDKENAKKDATESESPARLAPANSQIAPQKIPESELEGTIYESPAKHDAQAPAR